MWDKLDEALAELLLCSDDHQAAAVVFAKLHNLPVQVVKQRIRLILQQTAHDIQEVNISPAMRLALGLQQRMPLRHRRRLAEFLGYAMEAVSQIYPLTVPVSPSTPQQESLCLLLGDWHIGAHIDLPINRYDQEVAQKRVEKLIHNTLKLSTCYIRQEIKELVVLIVGDMVDGAEIFDTQPYHQELAVLEQIQLASSLLWQMFLTFSQSYERVRVHAVRGNHGRMSKTAPPEANWDLMLYLMLQKMWLIAREVGSPIAGKLEISFSANEFDTVLVNGKRIQIRHEAPKQTETPAASSRFSGYHDISPYDIICYGHYHHPGIEWHQDRPVIKNGSLMGPNDLSNRMGKISSPKQYLFSVPGDQDKAISFSYPIFLNDVDKG